IIAIDMIHDLRPPPATRFPYTTLFRSPPQRWLWDINLVKPALIAIAVWAFGSAMIIFLAGLQDVPQTLYEAADLDGASAFSKLIDRKSTRLNSSHVKISYAVFCLKKKR